MNRFKCKFAAKARESQVRVEFDRDADEQLVD
jgi:hypothetical protein